MSVRKILNGSSGYTASTASVSAPSEPNYDSVTLLLTGDTVVDDQFANVSLLLTGNDLLDKSNNKLTMTSYGNAAITNTKKKFGTSSYYFDGNADYLGIVSNSALTFGSSDFTIECWYYPVSLTGSYPRIIGRGSSTGGWGTNSWALLDRSQSTVFGFAASNNTSANLSSTTVVKDGVWYHLAVTFTGGIFRLFVNGILEASSSTANTTSIDGDGSTSNYIWVGGTPESGNNWACSNSYIDDLRVTKGVARYTTNFTPPAQAYPTHEILDSSVYRYPITAYGNARINTTTKKYGTGSMYFDGSGDYVSATTTNLLLGSGDFTIECWYNPIAKTNSYPGIFGTAGASNWGADQITLIDRHANISSNNITFFVYNYSSVTPLLTSTTTITNGNWYHIAITRSGSTFKLFINGAVESTGTFAGTIDSSNRLFYIGSAVISTNDFINGYIDDFRITKGLARYTANFTPPTAALPTIPPTISADPWWGNVSLLLDGNTTDEYDPYWQNVSLMLTGDDFIDWSNQHGTVTTSGSTTLTTATTKYRSNAIQLNGTGTTYLSIPSSTALNMTGDFTMEYWAYFTNLSTNPVVLSKWASGNYSYHIGCDITVGNGFFFIYSTTGSGGGVVFIYSGTAPVLNTWTHYAVSVSGTTLRMFVNGTLVKTATISAIYAGTEKLIIGNNQDPGYSTNSYMILSDIRITKGVARYTANFTPPTAALPAYKIQDRTPNALTLTPNGNVQLSTDVKKNGTGSMFFDGTGDYILSSMTALSTGDFTVELWLYALGTPNDTGILECRTDGNAATTNGFTLTALSSSVIRIYSNGALIATSGTTFVGQWTHIAITRASGTWTLYINGVSQGTSTASRDLTNADIVIGGGRYGSNGTVTSFLTGYIDDLRTTKGYARYSQNFTPPSQSFATQYISTGFDPHYANVSFLMSADGTNGSTTFTDLSSSPKTITKYGNAQISTTQKKYGTGSMSFDATGSYIAFDDASGLGSNNFTIDFWMYTKSSSWDLFSLGATANTDYAGFAFVNSGVVYISTSGAGWNWTGLSCGNFPLNTWIHMAFTRDGDNLKIWNNGILITTQPVSGAFANKTGKNFIGVKSDNMSYGFNGYVDDFRITIGVVRYTTNFTPPTYSLATTAGTPFDINRADTALLIRGNGTNGSTSFVDESPNNLTVTAYGNSQISTSVKKYGTGSAYFDGVGDYLNIANSSITSLGTSDFTIELWYQPTAAINSYPRIVCRGTMSNDWTTDCWYLNDRDNNSSTTKFVFGANNIGVNFLASTTTVVDNTWYHLAVTRQGSTFRLFVNGIVESTYTSAASVDATTTGYIGVGGCNSGQNIKGYIDDLRITKGYARYTANFTPPTYEDPITTGTQYDYNYPQVTLLLNGDGTNGSTTFTDLSSSPKTITNTGSVSVSTADKKFGTGSIMYSSLNYLSVPMSTVIDFSGTFTIEAWCKYTSTGDMVNIINTPNRQRYIGILSSTCYVGDGSVNIISASTFIGSNTWAHIAIVKNGSLYTLYINGVSIATSSTAMKDITDTTLLIGRDPSYSATSYLDDLRVTKGVARYTQNFTPPTAPLPTSGGY